MLDFLTRNRIIAHSDRLWSQLEERKSEMIALFTFASCESEAWEKMASELLELSLKLILAELLVNEEELRKFYPPTNYGTSSLFMADFAKELSLSFLQGVPKKTNQRIAGARKKMWGYVLENRDKLLRLAAIMSKIQKGEVSDEAFKDDDLDLLLDCGTIAYVESAIRHIELEQLEKEG